MPDSALLHGENAAFIEGLYRSYLRDPASVDPSWHACFEEYAREEENRASPSSARAAHAPPAGSAPLAAPGPAPRTPPDGEAAGASLASGASLPARPHPDILVNAPAERYALVLAGTGATRSEHAGALSELADKQAKVLHLINAIRYRGHWEADVDPLDLYERPRMPDTHPEYYGFGPSDMTRIFNTGSVFMAPEAPLAEICSLLRDTYCRSIGTELTHVSSTEQKRWVQERLERARGRPNFDRARKRDLLYRVTAARKLEEYLHRKYVGQKRFSLEGGENMITMLDEIIQRAGTQGVREAIIGMAHRGRLNVLVNILGKHPATLFGEFEGKTDAVASSGDVKYHLGFSSDIESPGGPMHLVLAFNPSHLEIINPVVEGSVRARQERRGDRERNAVLPILVHGDAAFAGQGVVTETLNLSETRGYGTGGTIHIVVNNQIGFTTSDPLDTRSTLYCTDVAKLVQAPIFHVNGNDTEAAVFTAQIAFDFRMRFKKDVVLDLVCFRRWGHNEADEPLATQPMMYKKIRTQKGARRAYAEQLVREGVIGEGEDREMSEACFRELEENRVMSRPLVRDPSTEFIADWSPYVDTHWRADADTAIPLDRIETLGVAMCRYPADFELHRSVRRILDARLEMMRGERPMDWGFAENLAYASLLDDGYPVRLSGQDSQRGTFFHRHAVLHNQKRRGTYTPLQHLTEGQPRFEVINSLLSEEAVLAFEYGFATAEPETLIIWEAQFGDFANGAQVIVRPVPELLRIEVGALLRAGDVPAPRLRRARTRAFVGAPGALPAALRRRQRPGVHPEHPRPDVPPAAAPDAAALSQAPHRHDPQEPVAPPARDIAPGNAGPGGLPAPHRRDGSHRPRPRHPGGAVRRKGLLRPGGETPRAGSRPCRPGTPRTALPHPAGGDPGGRQALPQGRRDLLDAGGAAQPGGVAVHDLPAPSHRSARQAAGAQLRGPGLLRVPGGRLSQRAPGGAARPGGERARSGCGPRRPAHERLTDGTRAC